MAKLYETSETLVSRWELNALKNDVHDSDYIKRIEFEPFCENMEMNIMSSVRLIQKNELNRRIEKLTL